MVDPSVLLLVTAAVLRAATFHEISLFCELFVSISEAYCSSGV